MTCFVVAACSDERRRVDGRSDDAPDADREGAGSNNVDAGPADAGRDASRPRIGHFPSPPPTEGLWSHRGYDPRNWYFNPTETTLAVENADRLVEKWRFNVEGNPLNTPIIAEGRVFVMATGGTYAIDIETGAAAWERVDLEGTAALAYDGGFLYAHVVSYRSPNQKPNLYKLDAANGSTVWGPVATNDFQGCGAMSSPVVAGDKVLVGRECGAFENALGDVGDMPRGGVGAFYVSDGAPAWTYLTAERAEDGASVWSTVSVDFDRGIVFAATDNNYSLAGSGSDAIHAIDLATGSQVWVEQVREGDVYSLFWQSQGHTSSAAFDVGFGASPMLGEVDGRSIIGAADKAAVFWALDRATGSIVWSRNNLDPSGDGAFGGEIIGGAFDGERFYAIFEERSSGTSVLRALAARNGEDAWQPRGYPNLVWGVPSLANGLLLAPIDDELHVLDAKTGDELKVFNTGGTSAGGAAAIAAGRIVVASGFYSPIIAPMAKDNHQITCYGLP